MAKRRPRVSEAEPSGQEELRRRAEERLKGHRHAEFLVPDDPGALKLLHELEVHQIELEMQNEALKSARQEAELDRARYAELYDSAPDGYVTLDRQGTMRRVNRAAAELLGINDRGLVGVRLGLFILSAERRAFLEFLRSVFEGGKRLSREFTLAGEERGGEARAVRIAAQASRDGLECLALLDDVTERNRLLASLRSATEAKDRFLASLSHELRTPLTPVLGASQSLEADRTLSPEARDSAAVIRRNVELEARLVDDMLDLSRIISGKLSLSFAQADLHAIIREAAGIREPEARAKGVALDLRLEAGRREVRGDPGRLRQVLWNLLSNAVKFTPPGGAITVRTGDRPDGKVFVEVADTGIGLAAEDLSRIFESFVQGSPEGARKGGLGLGLAISKSIAELHGGSLAARSEGPGRGAVFTLELPARPPEAPGPPRERAGPAGRTRRLRVLLVEDHPDTLKVYAALLRRNGLEVLTAQDMASALRIAAEGAFDLLISDLLLPDGSGHDLMRRLGSDRPVKGIALTGLGMEEDVERSREAGFAEHLTKPVLLEELLQAIRRVAGDEWFA